MAGSSINRPDQHEDVHDDETDVPQGDRSGAGPIARILRDSCMLPGRQDVQVKMGAALANAAFPRGRLAVF
jgi:hypothetical protein